MRHLLVILTAISLASIARAAENYCADENADGLWPYHTISMTSLPSIQGFLIPLSHCDDGWLLITLSGRDMCAREFRAPTYGEKK